jgi:hypothetical protein
MKARSIAFLSVLLITFGVSETRSGKHGDSRRASKTISRDGGLMPAATSHTSSATGFDVAAHLTNRDLSTQAELIVIGECLTTMTTWIDRNLYTLATISVSEVLKGEQSSAVTVALPGGVDANRKIPVAMTYPGAPHISAQEDVFLFLIPADDQVAGSYAVVGFAQGKFSIVPGDQAVPMVARNLMGLRLQGDNKLVPSTDLAVPLAAFKEEIKSYLQPQ